MVKELSFVNLPFVPEKGDVIYVEGAFDERLNLFIRKHYEWLRETFSFHGLHFCYLPLRAEEAVDYHAPYLTSEERQAKIRRVPSLANYLMSDEDIKPSLVFPLDTPEVKAPCDIILQSVAIETSWLVPTTRTFSQLAKEIEKAITDYRLSTRISETQRDESDIIQTRFAEHNVGEQTVLFRIDDSVDADCNFDRDSQQLIDEIRERVEALRNKGINTMFLHDIIDESEHLSRLRITKDYRIYLVDYHNMEIDLPVLPKAVFLLFLQHPEGIRFKELTDYYSELLQIYLKLRPIGGRKRQEQSVRDVTDPRRNSINEKCARIREAFVRNFDDRLAKNYYITGKRGEAKRIVLDKSMVIWE